MPKPVVRFGVSSLCSGTLLFIIRIYQLTISQLFTGSCRFVPSCSVYASEAVLRHGALWGFWLAVLRVLRCNPFFRGGLDEVPISSHHPR